MFFKKSEETYASHIQQNSDAIRRKRFPHFVFRLSCYQANGQTEKNKNIKQSYQIKLSNGPT